MRRRIKNTRTPPGDGVLVHSGVSCTSADTVNGKPGNRWCRTAGVRMPRRIAIEQVPRGPAIGQLVVGIYQPGLKIINRRGS